MARINLVDKKVQMSLVEIIKFQILTHAFINDINLSELDLDCLTNLGLAGEIELTEFCSIMAEKRLQEKLKTWQPNTPNEKPPIASPQTIRNVLTKVEKDNLLVKNGKGRKKIMLNPNLKIQTEGNIVLNYKFYRIESKESK
jgi:hypothetical protein